MIKVRQNPDVRFLPDPPSVNQLKPIVYFDNLTEVNCNFDNYCLSFLYNSVEETYHRISDCRSCFVYFEHFDGA